MLRSVILVALFACKESPPPPGGGDPGTTPQTTTEPTTQTNTGTSPTATSLTNTIAGVNLVGCTNTSWAASVATDGRSRVLTTHYELEWAGSPTEAEDVARSLEAQYNVLENLFGTPAPHEPWKVSVYATEQQFRQAIVDDGDEAAPGVGGWFSYLTEDAYAYIQPTQYYSRVLTLHEAVHQFQLVEHQAPRGFSWFGEGLAEWLGRHDWNGECIRIGARPLVSLDDIFEQALIVAEDGDLDYDSLLDNNVWSRPRVFALTASLARNKDRQIRDDYWAFVREMNEGINDPKARFEEVFGDLSALEGQSLQHLQTDQQPFWPTYNEWYPMDQSTVRGFIYNLDPYSSMAPMKEVPQQLSFSMDMVGDYGGVVGAYTDINNYSMIYVAASGEVSVFDVAEGAYSSWNTVGFVSAQSNPMSLVWRPQEGELIVGGESITINLAHEPAAGFSLYAADVIFYDIEIEE